MQRSQLSIILFIATLTLVLTFQNCSRFEVPSNFDSQASVGGTATGGTGTGTGGTSSGGGPRGYYKIVNSQILQPKCNVCHSATAAPSAGGGFDLSTYAKIVSANLIVPNSTANSLLFTQVQSGAMPLGASALSNADMNLIQSWINNGALGNELPLADAGVDQAPASGTSVVLHGTGTDIDGTITAYLWTQVSGPSTATLTNATTSDVTVSNTVAGTYVFKLQVTDDGGATATDTVNVIVPAPISFAALNTTIFAPKCASCHGAVAPSGGYSLNNYAGLITRVTSGNAAGSKLYQRVQAGDMPPGGPLTSAEMNEIRDWINQGAKNN